MSKIDVIENKDGSLVIRDGSKIIDKILPIYDLDLSLKLLEEFNGLCNSSESYLYEYSYKGYYIFPSIQEYIFWDYFVPIVKYKELFEKYDIGVITYKNGVCNCSGSIGLDKYFKLVDRRTTILSRFFHNLIVSVREKFQICKSSILFYDDGADGFRYKEVKKTLSNIKDFCRVDFQLKTRLIKQLKYKKCFPYGYRKLIYKKHSQNLKLTGELLFLKRCRFNDFIRVIDEKCQDIVSASNKYEKKLYNSNFKILITYDQIEAVNSLIIAAKLNKIPVISYQHGIITKYHAGWIAPGISSELCNLRPDYIVVWGRYWKSKLSLYSNKYADNDIIIGCHPNKVIKLDKKLFLERHKMVTANEIHILYPYEFMANHISVSKFFKIFIDFGIKITIKVRPLSLSDPASGNLKCDRLSYPKHISDKISFIYELPDNGYKDFDIIACTQSTFAYEAMQFNKTIWYMDTDFSFIDSIYTDGIAHRVTLNNIKGILGDKKSNQSFYCPKYDLNLVEGIFSQNKMKAVINQIMKFSN